MSTRRTVAHALRHQPLRRRPPRAGLAGLAVGGLVLVLASPGAAAAENGDIAVTNTETVKVYTDASGAVESARVYEQVVAEGTGNLYLVNPVETDGLRNLDGFSGVETQDGDQVSDLDVDGTERLRTVSDYTGDLPLAVSVVYLLDGEEVEPADLVGEDGALEVRYTVVNQTAIDQVVEYPDGTGGTATSTVPVPIPMVGSLTTTAPSSFSDVDSDQANMAGDGRGGTKLSFTMTLFPPIGSDTAEFGYTATITDGVVPTSEVTALPVNPLDSPTFATAAEGYSGGAKTGAELAAGATEIDANVLKLRDGAADLLAGLIRLDDGAAELNTGLVTEAAPGARRLAAGLGTAQDGGRQLAEGANALDDGLGSLGAGIDRLGAGVVAALDGSRLIADGLGTASDGGDRLADGASDLDDGLDTLDAGAERLSDGLGTARRGGKKLADGASALDAGLGSLGTGAGDLSSGAQQLQAGQQALAGGLDTLAAGVDALPTSVREKLADDPTYQALLGSLGAIAQGVGTRGDAPTTPTLLGGINKLQAGLGGATGGLDQIVGRLDGALQGPATVPGTLASLLAAIGSIKAQPGCDAACAGYVDAVSQQVENGQRTSLTTLRDGVRTISEGIKSGILSPGAGLDQLRAGLSNGDPATCLAAKQTPDPSDDCGIREGAIFLQQAGIPMLVDAITTGIRAELSAGIGTAEAGCDPQASLRCAAAALAQGGGDLVDGVGLLVDGVDQLSAGGALLSTGAEDLSSGLTRLDGGAEDLADGAGRAAAGSGRLAAGATDLSSGLTRLDDGAEDLTSGLGAIDDGTGQLADGAGRAVDGSGRLAAGADELSGGLSLLFDGAGALAEGLVSAADGSRRLSEGLSTAADGAPRLVEGAGKLSRKGTSKLVEAGEDTAQNFGALLATMEAGAERADAEKMAYGAPAGATGLTAYSFVVQGEDGEGGRNLTRGLIGLGLLGVGTGVVGLRRRFA